MLARIVKICILGIILTLAGTACKSTKPKLSAEPESVRTHYVQDGQFDNRR